MYEPLPWWRSIDFALMWPFRVIQFGLVTWRDATGILMDQEDAESGGFHHAHYHSISIWRLGHWLQHLGPRLDDVLHEFTACAQGISKRGDYFKAASMHELAYRLLVRWVRDIEDTAMYLEHGKHRMMFFPSEFGKYDHMNPTPEAFESHWDADMRIWARPATYEGGEALKWQDIRKHFYKAIGSQDDEHCPTRDEFAEMEIILRQEVCRAYARRVELRAMRGQSRVLNAPADKEAAPPIANGDAPKPARPRLRPAESTVLEVIAASTSRLTAPQIKAILDKRPQTLGESTIKSALGMLTTHGWIDNRQDDSPPGYAVTSMYPGIDFPD